MTSLLPQKATTRHWEREHFSRDKKDERKRIVSRKRREDRMKERERNGMRCITAGWRTHAVGLNRLRDVLINSGSWVWLPTTTQKAFSCSSYLLLLAFTLFLFLISWPHLTSDLWPLHCVCEFHLKVSICIPHSLWRAEKLEVSTLKCAVSYTMAMLGYFYDSDWMIFVLHADQCFSITALLWSTVASSLLNTLLFHFSMSFLNN